jgi:hypothetical protein
MNDKNVLFKKVEMENGSVKSTTEIQGHVIDRVPELISKNDVTTTSFYYLVADDNGYLHQVKPFNIIKILK